mgnify:FL=1
MTDVSGQSTPCTSERTSLGKAYSVCIESPVIDDIPLLKIPDFSVMVLSDLRTSSSEFKKSKIPFIIPIDSIIGKARWIWLSSDPDSSVAGLFPKIRFERMLRRI